MEQGAQQVVTLILTSLVLKQLIQCTGLIKFIMGSPYDWTNLC